MGHGLFVCIGGAADTAGIDDQPDACGARSLHNEIPIQIELFEVEMTVAIY